MNELQTVTFAGVDLQCTLIEGEIYVGFKRTCEGIGIGYASQYQKLRKSKWATVTMIVTVGLDGKEREMVMVTLKTLTKWLSEINVNKVNPSIRPTLIQYQKEVADIIYEHFFGPTPQEQEMARQGHTTESMLQMEERILKKISNLLNPFPTDLHPSVFPSGLPGMVHAPIEDPREISKRISSLEEIAARDLIDSKKHNNYVECLAMVRGRNNSIAHHVPRSNWDIDKCLTVASYMLSEYNSPIVTAFYELIPYHKVRIPVWVDRMTSLLDKSYTKKNPDKSLPIYARFLLEE